MAAVESLGGSAKPVRNSRAWVIGKAANSGKVNATSLLVTRR